MGLATENTGFYRSLTLTVTKYVDGEAYTTQIYDGKKAFDWLRPYKSITVNELQNMPYSTQDAGEGVDSFTGRLEAFKAYIESLYPGLDLDTDLDSNFPAYGISDTDNCPVETRITLEITNVDLSCSGDTLTITVTGGTAPYYYSINNYETFVGPITEPIYTFTGIIGTTINIVVKDSEDLTDTWDELTCEQISVTFTPIYLNSCSYGYILDESATQHTSSFTITQDVDSTYTPTGYTQSGTTLYGWSYQEPRNTISYINNNYIQINPVGIDPLPYTHTFINDVTIYAVYIKDCPASKDFCFFPTDIGYEPTDEDKEFYCSNCDNIVTLYYDFDDYYSLGFTNITGYTDVELTIIAPHGHYLPVGDYDTTPMYEIVNGVAIPDGFCNVIEITCLPVSLTPTQTPTATINSTPPPTPSITLTNTPTVTPTSTPTSTPMTCNATIVPSEPTCELFIPEGFSPNGDNINDYFQMYCIQKYPNSVLRIFDRWGDLIYGPHIHYGNVSYWGTYEASLWNGRHNNGSILASTTFVYVLELGDGGRRSGTVFISY